MAKKIWLGVLLLVILSASFYFMLPGKVRIDITKTRTIFKVFEDGSFVISGIEYTRIFDGTKLMRAKERSIDYTIGQDVTEAYRYAKFKDNISAEDFYYFSNTADDIESVPISHKICFKNATGKIFEYLINNIYYDGFTKDIISPFSFGHNMKVYFQEGYYRAKVYQNKVAPDKIIIRYRITQDDQCFDVRLFDPQVLGAGNINITILYPINNSNHLGTSLDLNWSVNSTNLSWCAYSLDGGANDTSICGSTTYLVINHTKSANSSFDGYFAGGAVSEGNAYPTINFYNYVEGTSWGSLAYKPNQDYSAGEWIYAYNLTLYIVTESYNISVDIPAGSTIRLEYQDIFGVWNNITIYLPSMNLIATEFFEDVLWVANDGSTYYDSTLT